MSKQQHFVWKSKRVWIERETERERKSFSRSFVNRKTCFNKFLPSLWVFLEESDGKSYMTAVWEQKRERELESGVNGKAKQINWNE